MCPDNTPKKKPEELFKLLSTGNTGIRPESLSGLSLAFIGDAVYELYVRSLVLSRGEARVKALHTEVTEYVNASFQARAAELLSPMLTQDETDIFKRGRNAHSAHTPKNKTEAEYHKATGFEALVGYLWLKKDFERLAFILNKAVD